MLFILIQFANPGTINKNQINIIKKIFNIRIKN